MGLLQKAYETYENHHTYVGTYTAETREPLAPISHIVTSAQIEITINKDGKFVSASTVDKKESKITIPVTEDSCGRTSGVCPHPLCDNIDYISPNNPQKYDAYVEQLKDWCDSEYTHPMLPPILKYVEGKTVLSNLADSNIKVGEKDTVRWIVVGLEENGGACWTNKSLFESFIKYYVSKKAAEKTVLCMVSGENAIPARQHIKGVVAASGNAKIISANDKYNFTYRGRFETDEQALTVGYEASQKAHNALKWIVASQGVIIGGRTFVCWNPQGKKVPNPIDCLFSQNDAPTTELAQYRQDLLNVLNGYGNNFSPADTAVIATFDAATSGRLAVTYYNEILVSDFLENLEKWDSECVWKDNRFGISAPSIRRIINCAFGNERGGKIEADEGVMKQQVQRLAICRVEGKKIPYDIMKAIAVKTFNPLSYETKCDELLFTACAVIRKYYMDWKGEEYQMALEKDKKDISYQYGRLLAVLEKAERDTYDRNESRDTNAVRMQSVFCNRPAQTAKIVIEQLKNGYYPKLSQGGRTYYDNLIGEIYEKISEYPESTWNKPLKETYIMGYYLQRNELYKKKENNDSTEVNEDE